MDGHDLYDVEKGVHRIAKANCLHLSNGFLWTRQHEVAPYGLTLLRSRHGKPTSLKVEGISCVE